MTRLNPWLFGLVLPKMRLLRGLSGRVLSCGCLLGVYETYGGGIIAMVDARGTTCTEAGHALHAVVNRFDGQTPAAPAGDRVSDTRH